MSRWGLGKTVCVTLGIGKNSMCHAWGWEKLDVSRWNPGTAVTRHAWSHPKPRLVTLEGGVDRDMSRWDSEIQRDPKIGPGARFNFWSDHLIIFCCHPSETGSRCDSALTLA